MEHVCAGGAAEERELFRSAGRSVAPSRGQEATRCRQGASSSTHAEMTVTQKSVSVPAMCHGQSARLESCELTRTHTCPLVSNYLNKFFMISIRFNTTIPSSNDVLNMLIKSILFLCPAVFSSTYAFMGSVFLI